MSLWTTFAETIKKKPKTGEHEAGRPESYQMGSVYDDVNPNKFYEEIRNAGGLSQAVEEMESSDPKLFGWMQTRMLAILSLDRKVTGDGEPADFIRLVMGGWKNFHNTLLNLLSCIPCGFSVIEKVWEIKDGRFIIEKLKNWSPDRFFFKAGELYLGDGFLRQEIADPNKFAVCTYMPKNGSPWGTALYHRIYTYWFMKKHSTKFWAIYEERFGAPITQAIVPDKDFDNANSPVMKTVRRFIKEVHKKTGPSIITPEGVQIVLKEANSVGATGSYEKFIDFLDAAIVIAILGQTLTSDTGGTGSYSLGKVHERVRLDILAADVLMVESFINDEIIRPLVDFNFEGVTEYPKLIITIPTPEDKKTLAEVVTTLAKGGMKSIPVSYIHKKLGIPIPIDNEPCLDPPAAPAALPQGGLFSESEVIRQSQIQRFLADLRQITR